MTPEEIATMIAAATAKADAVRYELAQLPLAVARPALLKLEQELQQVMRRTQHTAAHLKYPKKEG